MNRIVNFTAAFSILCLYACAVKVPNANDQTTYQALGGAEKIREIVDNFIEQIAFDKTTFEHFKDSNVDRFAEKLREQLCVETGGPCTYSGDSMAQVHANMNISEAEFNRTVELLINAMTKAQVPHRLQNKVLAKLAPMRGDIIYQ